MGLIVDLNVGEGTSEFGPALNKESLTANKLKSVRYNPVNVPGISELDKMCLGTLCLCAPRIMYRECPPPISGKKI